MTSMHHSGSGRSFSQVSRAAMVLIAVLLCVEQLLAFR
ncbi:hypothetical protein HDG37_007328 [Paraburkholderia sp. MM5384-R2]|nr:hypothetical protein [Paraburkholderia sp. MM5384-R2]